MAPMATAADRQAPESALVKDGLAGQEIPLPKGVYRAGTDVPVPTVLTEVYPRYTAEAMKAEIRGAVRLACVVGPDGRVGDVRIVRSLDTQFGLDEEAVRSAKQWRFEPTLKDGTAVPVMVVLDLTFVMTAQEPDAKPHRNIWSAPLKLIRIF